MTTCGECGKPARLVKGDVVYPHRPDLATKKFWACMDCKTWVGCHPGTEKPLGRLSNAASRKLKSAAHAAFDPLWQSGGMTRKQAYAWLREQLNLNRDACHIGMMSDEDLQRVIDICED